MKYVVVIPAKNEALHIEKTLRSIENQRLLPEACLVVNDGSTDQTGDIIQQFADRLPFLIQHDRPTGDPSYSLGGKVVRVFNEGKHLLDARGIDYDFIVKLDADTSFDGDFAHTVLTRMEEQGLGIASGTPYFFEGGRKVFEFSPDWHTHGQFKFYRRQALEKIGGLRESLGWDTADNIHAMDAGWNTKAFRDVNYEMHRQVGGKVSLANGRRNHGRGAHLLGYDPSYFALRCAHDVFKPPLFVGALQMAAGYLEAPRGDDPLLNERQRTLLRQLLWQGLGDRLRAGDFAILQRLKGFGRART